MNSGVKITTFVNDVSLQTDENTRLPKIWINKDKMSGCPKGDATITYNDINAARSAVGFFNGRCLLWW